METVTLPRLTRRSSKSLSKRVVLTLMLLVFGGALLSSDFFGSTSAQKRTGRVSSKPNAKPSPAPTGVDGLGPAPPIPKLKPTPEPRTEDINPGEVISVETTEIMLPVTVRDSQGRLVSNLTRDEFRVFEDSSEQPLRDIALRQVPVDA